MVLQMLRYGRGHVRVRVTGSSYERFLNMCAKHEILIWDLLCAGDSYEMNMTIQGFRMLKPMARKCGVRIRILKNTDFPFSYIETDTVRCCLRGLSAGSV